MQSKIQSKFTVMGYIWALIYNGNRRVRVRIKRASLKRRNVPVSDHVNAVVLLVDWGLQDGYLVHEASVVLSVPIPFFRIRRGISLLRRTALFRAQIPKIRETQLQFL